MQFSDDDLSAFQKKSKAAKPKKVQKSKKKNTFTGPAAKTAVFKQ